MNSFKKTQSNWILCPSKSIPGKFYYFNVVTGEAVWGLDDIQTNALRKDNNIPKVADKSHTYPEPQMHNMSEEFSNVYSNMGNLYQQIPSTTCPRYGQAVFPQYFSNVTPSLMPSVIWTPIQMPMLMTNERKVSDRNTQTFDIVNNLDVQTCKMPLSKRFALLGNSKKVSIFGSSSGSIARSSLMCTENRWNQQSLLNRNGLLKDQTQHNNKKIDKSIIIREPKLQYPKPALENTISNKNIKPNKVKDSQYSINYDEENEKVEFNNPFIKKLDKNDLRYLLISKRKSANLGVLNDDNENEEKVSNDSHKELPEKKVTFDENTSDNGTIITVLDGDETPTPPIPIKFLRDLGKIIDPTTTWYIVVDRDILLDDIDFIMEYIDGDEFCKLLVPKSILKNIQSLGIGDGKYPIVLKARQIYRRLVNTSSKVNTVDIKEVASMHDDVLNCCLQAIEKNLHVVLITKHIEVYEKAHILGIHTYYLDDIKTDNPRAKSPTFDFQPIKVTVKNKNLFPQRDEREQFVTIKSDNLSNVNDNICNDKNNDNDNTQGMLALNTNILKLDLNSSKGIKRVIKNDENDKMIDTATDNNKNMYINEKKSEEIINCSGPEDNEIKPFKPWVFQKVFFKQNGLKNKLALINDKKSDNSDQKDSLKKDATTPKTLIRNKDNGGFYDWESIVLTTDNESNNRSAKDKYQIEDKIKRFYIKDKVTEQNIIARMGEYSCCYIQIMEEFLNIVLKKNTFVQKCLPCSFLEGLEYLKEFYFDVKIKKIIEELMSFWKKGDNIKMNVKPSDFIRMIGRGWLLVDSLKNIIPDEIEEIKYKFTKLMENIKNPIIQDVELMQTPKRRSNDVFLRSNYVKDKSEIVEYLKKNFVEWKDYETTKPDNSFKNIVYNDKVHIIRTSGKHLNRLQIHNKKQITMNNHSHDENSKNLQKPQRNGQTDLNIPVLHENTFDTNNDGPKVIRNVKPIDEFEEKMNKINNQLNFNDQCSEIVDTMSCTIENNYINKLNNNDNLKRNDKFDNGYKNNDHYSLIEANNNDTLDSGFENDSLYTCTFVRNFLKDLSSSFKLIYTFIDKCHHEFSCGVMEEDEKKSLCEKAKQTHKEMCAIIDKLKSIIERESLESTKLKLLLKKAGLDVAEDKRVARYRQTVIKCLEQAQILNCCLKLILSTNEDDVIDDNTSFHSYDLLSYFNLFE